MTKIKQILIFFTKNVIFLCKKFVFSKNTYKFASLFKK